MLSIKGGKRGYFALTSLSVKWKLDLLPCRSWKAIQTEEVLNQTACLGCVSRNPSFPLLKQSAVLWEMHVESQCWHMQRKNLYSSSYIIIKYNLYISILESKGKGCSLSHFMFINLQSLGLFQKYKGNIKIPFPQEPIFIFQSDLVIQGPNFAQWKYKLF